VHPEQLAPVVRERMRTLIALGDDVESVAVAFGGGRRDVEVHPPPRPQDSARWACVFTTGAPAVWMQPAPPRRERKRHRRKYAEGELGADKSFYFRGADRRLNLRTHNLAMFSQIAEGIDDATWVYHLRQRDYSRWFREAIKDEALASTASEVEEDEHLSPAESRARIRQAIEERYTSPA
jgi:hypothetical protein